MIDRVKKLMTPPGPDLSALLELMDELLTDNQELHAVRAQNRVLQGRLCKSKYERREFLEYALNHGPSKDGLVDMDAARDAWRA